MDALHNHILGAARRWFRKQVAWRRHLHQHPELSFGEFKTTSYLRKTVRSLGLELMPLTMETGLLAQLKGDQPGPTVAMRTDIDALPIVESTGLRYRPKVEGCMHACGHDMHMAVVLGAAAVLSEIREKIPGTVRFIFQPAEESPPGGALPLIENGAMDGVSMIFGLHVDPSVPTGKIGLRDGVTMASVIDFDIVIQGRGGHAARPHDAVDAIVTAGELIHALQTIVAREIDPISPVAITIGRIEGGGARNVIAESVKLKGTARALSDKAVRELPRRIKRTAMAICQARGAKAEVTFFPGYPVLDNHPRANEIFRKNFSALFGRGKIVQTPLVLGGEDFARYLQLAPGAMFRLGCRNPKIGAVHPWHSSKFKVDEKALVYGTALLCAAVLDSLTGDSL